MEVVPAVSLDAWSDATKHSTGGKRERGNVQWNSGLADRGNKLDG